MHKRAETTYEVQDGDLILSVNARTGETLEEYRYDARAKPKEADWVKLYQRMAAEMAQPGRIKSVIGYQVLLHLLAVTSYGNGVLINQAELARAWGVNRSTIWRAVQELTRLGVVETVGKHAGRGGTGFRLNPTFAWKGGDELRRARVAKWAETHSDAQQISEDEEEQTA